MKLPRKPRDALADSTGNARHNHVSCEQLMTSIGGPGGIGGPKGPGGPQGPEGPGDVDDVADVHDSRETTAAAAATPGSIDALAADLAAGKLTPHEAIDRLVEATATPELGAAERAELRELITDLVANDPHLAALASRL